MFETHATTEDNEQGRATGWLPGQLAERGRAQARRLEDLVEQDFAWQEGWEYRLG